MRPSRASRFLIPVLALVATLPACSRSGTDRFQGYVEGEFVYLGSSQPGHLDRLAVSRGQTVERGARLFTLEATEERAAQHQAAEQLAAAEATRADLDTGKRPAEVAVVRAQLAQAEAAATKSAQQRDRDAVQFKGGGVSREQLEASEAAARADAARVTELGNQLAVAQLPGREQQLKAQARQVEAAKAALAQADWRVEQKSVSAPSAGLVYDTLFREGEWVAAGSPVVRLLPPGNVKVRFFVPETVLGGLTVGRPVVLACDGCASEIPAAITFVSPQAEYTPPVIYSNDTRGKLVYMIEAHPAPADATKLRPGQPLEVRLK